jgi:hypothetical protein
MIDDLMFVGDLVDPITQYPPNAEEGCVGRRQWQKEHQAIVFDTR